MCLRIAVHEVSHGIIAVVNGYILDSVRLDGPPHNPGQTDRTIPGGLDGNDPHWARKELALFCAGYLGEQVIYGFYEESYIVGHPESDRPMMDQCAVVHLQDKADIEAISHFDNPSGDGAVPRHLWRHCIPIDWQKYDDLILNVESEVRQELRAQFVAIWRLAKLLRRKKVIDGVEFLTEMT